MCACSCPGQFRTHSGPKCPKQTAKGGQKWARGAATGPWFLGRGWGTMSRAPPCGPEVKTAQPISHLSNTLMSDETASSLSESVHIGKASSSDSESSDTEERGNHQGTRPSGGGALVLWSIRTSNPSPPSQIQGHLFRPDFFHAQSLAENDHLMI